MEKHINIISFNVPYPPDYGGIIDVFYRIKYLSELGIKIHLHTFYYDRPKSDELNKYCESIHYYPRKRKLIHQFGILPFMVVSRKSKELLKNLCSNDYPIFFEGLHTSYCIKNKELKDRIKIIRMHNIEHEHYKNLALCEHNLLKRLYFEIETFRLKLYEKVVKKANHLLTISMQDQKYYYELSENASFLPPSHAYNEVIGDVGMGEYILYHGNLSLSENYEVVKFLINNVISKIKHTFIVAGMSSTPDLKKLCDLYPNIKLIANPDNTTMDTLIKEAHIHLLMVERSSGLRLKLLYSLYAGRHCIVNDMMLYGTNLAPVCNIANTPEDIILKVNELMSVPFTLEQKDLRAKFLSENYNNKKNAQKVIELL